MGVKGRSAMTRVVPPCSRGWWASARDHVRAALILGGAVLHRRFRPGAER